ncbi:hypothetical protein ACTS9T_14515 [Empedobacter falsenii]|uniref:hypothetical protein n=1 Tax=Empedobacter sp. GD03797 TaxID=2975382 RepID=UPI00244B146E|nr:hypothetical protein [Empedobacter sp. GD03797]MDH1881505.1 hypothetical protein [Empedobacter sp. GD03797]
MRFFLFFTVLIIGTISCSKKIDYQKTIQAIEANDNLFELNYELRGKMNVFYNDSTHYFYFENDTIENLRVFKSKILDDYKKLIHHPSKVSFYKYKYSYSIKVEYIENNIMQTDSLAINNNPVLSKLFIDSKKKSDFYKNNQIIGYYFNKKHDTKTYSLLNYNKLFYAKNSVNKNNDEFPNKYKISQKLNDKWYLLERKE